MYYKHFAVIIGSPRDIYKYNIRIKLYTLYITYISYIFILIYKLIILYSNF